MPAIHCTPPAHIMPWRVKPDGCRVLRPGQTLRLSAAVTEVDMWTIGYRHMRQRDETFYDSASCGRNWVFVSHAGSAMASWDTCNREVTAYSASPRRSIRVYWWMG